MSGDDHWTYATAEEAYKIADAISHDAGFPKKSVHATPGRHGPTPATWTEDAPGWTSRLVPVEERDDAESPGPPHEKFSVDQIDGITTPHEGKTINHPVHGLVTIPGKKAAKKKGGWKAKGKRPDRPGKKKGGKKKGGKKKAVGRRGKGHAMKATDESGSATTKRTPKKMSPSPKKSGGKGRK